MRRPEQQTAPFLKSQNVHKSVFLCSPLVSQDEIYWFTKGGYQFIELNLWDVMNRKTGLTVLTLYFDNGCS